MSRYGKANALSGFRLLVAVALAAAIWVVVPGTGWLVAVVFLILAALTEPLDGKVARGKDGVGSPRGKLLNEAATGFLCAVPQASLLGWLYLGQSHHWAGATHDRFEKWLVWCVIFVVGTLLFIVLKIVLPPKAAEMAEVTQAYFTVVIVAMTGIFMANIGWTESGHALTQTVRLGFGVTAFVVAGIVFLLTDESRRFARPQERERAAQRN